MKLHLVDGTYEVFRQFFGRPGVSGPDGMEIGAVQGMLRTLLTLVTTDGATHVAIAFDEVIESFRNDLFAGYKSGEGLDPVLWDQHPLAIEAARAMGMITWPMVRYETDDALASAAHQYRDVFEQVLICSPDKDFAQCVTGERVVLFDRRRATVLDEAAVVAKWGVPPAAIPDWLALVGDKADGIPGIPRWGAKSAATVLSHYGSLDAIPDDASAWDIKVRGSSTLADNLAAQRDDARLYRTLATLVTDVDLGGLTPDAFAWQGADRPALEALCRRIGFERFVDRVPRFR
jgi:5'-3' exonuclease